jgi:poly(glycerol-phosphate) alpha-glucosyltransferase
VAALAEAFQANASDRASLGAKGRRLVQQRFAWSTVAAQMASVYDWVLGGEKPSNVEICE